MKWIDHQVVTGFVVYTATGDLLLSAYSMVGALLPDQLEGSPLRGSYWRWRSRHRGWSHWPMLYLAMLGLLMDRRWDVLSDPRLWSHGSPVVIAAFALIGALLHIAEDAVCGRVPVFTPWKKHGLKLFKVGSFTEYFFCIGIVLLCVVVRLALSDWWGAPS